MPAFSFRPEGIRVQGPNIPQMSAKIAVLEAHQEISDSPRRHVKRSVAACLVRRALAVQVSKRLIRMIAIRDAVQILAKQHDVVIVPRILPPRAPDWTFTAYPIPDQRTIYV